MRTTSACDPASIFACPQWGMHHHLVYMHDISMPPWHHTPICCSAHDQRVYVTAVGHLSPYFSTAFMNCSKTVCKRFFDLLPHFKSMIRREKPSMHPCTARPQRIREWWPSKCHKEFCQGTECCLWAIKIPHRKAVFWEFTLMKLLRTLFFVLVIWLTSSNLLNTFFLLSNHDDLNILQRFHLFLHLTTHWSAACLASHKIGLGDRQVHREIPNN